MKTQVFTWMLLLFVIAAMPVAANDQEQDETILGLWHVQFMDVMGQKMVFSPDFTMQMTFGEDGQMRSLSKIDGETDNEDLVNYECDQKKQSLILYKLDADGNTRKDTGDVIRYSFKDGALILVMSKGEETMKMELSRKPEGTKRHQDLREKDDGKAVKAMRAARESARKMKSSTQMRGLLQAALIFSTSDKRGYPPSLGHMMAGEYFTPEYVLTPWTKSEVPEDFDDWQEQKKIDWANQNTGYVYLLAGKKAKLDREQLGIFELPRSADQKEIRLGFEDNSIRPMPYAEADKLIKKQTGHAIAEWMKTASPGTGEMVVPKDDEKAGE